MTSQKNYEVHREDNVLKIPALDSPLVVGSFIRMLHEVQNKKGYENVVLDFSEVESVFPNACTPVAGIIEFYRWKRNVTFTSRNSSDFFEHTKALEPVNLDLTHKSSPMDRVWSFSSSEEIKLLVDAYLDSISWEVECQPGVIQGLEWCLNEVMDNVLQHSESTHGYVMGQIHKNSQHVAICIYDYGQGVYNSLRESQHAPEDAVDAIMKSLEERVTRDEEIGQGNGLWGFSNIVRENSGLLNIVSGSGHVGIRNGETRTSTHIPYLSKENNGTTVDFQIDFNKGISIHKALGEYEPINLRIESLEDSNDNLVYKLAEKASGTGTRQSGVAIRNEVLNLMNQTDSLIILDFNGLAVISSSFADEFIGKLAVKCGFITFNQRFRLLGMNKIVQVIANRSVTQRFSTGLSVGK